MRILGIETSCDETAAAVVELNNPLQGATLQSNVVFSSMDLHAAYGGVVPEIAARSHIESITPVIEQALYYAKYGQSVSLDGVQGVGADRKEVVQDSTATANRKPTTQQSAKNTFEKSGFVGLSKSETDALWEDIDGIAVTYGAGLGGSLLVGVLTARTLAIAKNKPLYAINHVEGHIYANFLTCTGTPLPASSQGAEPRKGSLDAAALKAPPLSHSSTSTAPSAARFRLASHQSPAQVRQWTLGDQTYELRESVPEFPMLGLIVSGGHSQLVLWRDHFDYTLLGQTQDDAIGEAFDKVAKILGLPYPGGPSVGKKASQGDPLAYKLPKAKLKDKYSLSYSGLKTAVLRTAQGEVGADHTLPSFELPGRLNDVQKANIAASFQRTAIEAVVDKSIQAFEEFHPKSFVIGGGVAASPELRKQLSERLPIPVEYNDARLMTDNGAMIACLGAYTALAGRPSADPYSLDIAPNLSM